YLKTGLLITGSANAQLGLDFETRRLCKVRVVNIAEPVDLYELVAPDVPGWPELKRSYEDALRKFEQRELRPAASVLGKLVTDYRIPALSHPCHRCHPWFDGCGSAALGPLWFTFAPTPPAAS